MSATINSLRWVKYDGVYYAALLAPDDESPMPVENGHVFVYFLGSESGAVVPIEDTSPYDPNDTTRTTHPAAAEGVLVAQQLIAGAAAAVGEGDDANTNKKRIMNVKKHKKEKSPKKRKEKKNKSNKKMDGISEEEEWEKEEKEMVKASILSNTRNRKRYNDSDDDEAENVLLDLCPQSDKDQFNEENEEEGTSTHGNVNGDEEEQESRWKHIAETLDITTPNRVSGGRSRNNNRRSVDANSLVHDGESIVVPFLPELRYHYQKALTEAAEYGRLVNIQESDLVRIVEMELIAWRGQVLYLERLLEDVAKESCKLPNESLQTDDNGTIPLEGKAAAIRSRLDDVNSSFSLERILQKHLYVRDTPSDRPERRRTDIDIIKGGSGPSTFTDASLAFALDAQAFIATPRELPHQLAQRYREQRLRRERILASQYGLGKTGFTAPVSRVMGKWRQSRELMVLDPCRENQPVSRRYSESLAKVERHALKCLSSMPDSPKRLLSMYHTQQQQKQQIRKNIYNFYDLRNEEQHPTSTYQTNNSHPQGLTGDVYNSGHNEDDARDAFQAPLISPLRTSFDPRATFALDIGEIMHENALAENLATQSLQYSHSIRLPSHESVWEMSEMYEGAPRRRTGRSCSRACSMSLASSRASSMALDNNDGSNMNTNNTDKSASVGGVRHSRNDWRASAKRTILEQLTLYLRGIRGKPAVLNKEQFQFIAKKLLERAVRSESERSGRSMSLQANNTNALFTKDIELRLRKSVDNYILRHFVASRISEPQKRDRSGEVRTTSAEQWATTQRDTGRRQEEEDETHSVMGAYPHANDSPIYDQL